MKIELNKFIEIDNVSGDPFYNFLFEYFEFYCIKDYFIKIENYNITKNNSIEFEINFIKLLNIPIFLGNWLGNLIIKYLLYNTIVYFELKIGNKIYYSYWAINKKRNVKLLKDIYRLEKHFLIIQNRYHIHDVNSIIINEIID